MGLARQKSLTLSAPSLMGLTSESIYVLRGHAISFVLNGPGGMSGDYYIKFLFCIKGVSLQYISPWTRSALQSQSVSWLTSRLGVMCSALIDIISVLRWVCSQIYLFCLLSVFWVAYQSRWANWKYNSCADKQFYVCIDVTQKKQKNISSSR